MNIFVGCSSKNTENEAYNEAARKIGEFILTKRHNLVFGGCNTGLMGQIYSIVSQSCRDRIIICTTKNYRNNSLNLFHKALYCTGTVNERKNSFIELSDVMLFLPGGIGTIDEIFSAIEATRNQEHNIPIIIININNYFGYLLDMLNKIYDEGFANPENRELYTIVDTVEEALSRL